MGFQKRKAFGQHFLVDADCIEKTIFTALDQLNPDEAVLEIGPGDGALTNVLLERLPEGSLFVSEIDRELIKKWTSEPRVKEVIAGDFVQTCSEVLNRSPKWRIVSNLPYASGTAILIQLLSFKPKISKMVLMFQKEVALRLMAEPSTSDRGSLSVKVQNEWVVRLVQKVPPKSFKPAPKVDSMVVELLPREVPEIRLESSEDRSRFDEMLRQAFIHRRKMLRNNLGVHPLWAQALKASQIDPTLRAEALNFDHWRKLWFASKNLL